MAKHQEEPLPPGVPPVTFAPVAPRLRRPPFWIISLLIISVLASWIPLVLFARGRSAKSTEPRVALVQDMGTQVRYREQMSSEVFADGRADRPRIPGTVARGQANLDDNYYRGFTGEPVQAGSPHASGQPVKFVEGFPAAVTVDNKLLARGQERFNIYCSPCHGLDGYGNGMVHVRAQELKQGSWVQPASLHSDGVRARPEGHLFNTISIGIRTMPGYGGQIPVADRWAIVAYIRALQVSQGPQPAPPPLAAPHASAE